MGKEHLDICIESGADDLQPPAPKHTACVQSTVEILTLEPWSEEASTAEDTAVSL